MSNEKSIVWRRLDAPGHEYARCFTDNDLRRIDGTAIFVHESRFCKLDYRIECGLDWETRAAQIAGFVGERKIEIEIAVDREKAWTLNGEKFDEVAGCTDVDLNFSPVTNALPIRRLTLAVGEKAQVNAAWLRFPSFRLEPLAQVYERTSENVYHYESSGGSFQTDIETDAAGFVARYPNLWEIEK